MAFSAWSVQVRLPQYAAWGLTQRRMDETLRQRLVTFDSLPKVP